MTRYKSCSCKDTGKCVICRVSKLQKESLVARYKWKKSVDAYKREKSMLEAARKEERDEKEKDTMNKALLALMNETP